MFGVRFVTDRSIYTLAVATVQCELMFVIGTGVDPVWTHVAVIVAL